MYMKSLPIRTNPTPSEAKAKYVQRENELPDHSSKTEHLHLSLTREAQGFLSQMSPQQLDALVEEVLRWKECWI